MDSHQGLARLESRIPRDSRRGSKYLRAAQFGSKLANVARPMVGGIPQQPSAFLVINILTGRQLSRGKVNVTPSH